MKKIEEIQISVAMCTYNGEKYIREQIESILAQEVPVDEIVIRDDRSTDQTVKIAREVLAKSDVRYEVAVNEQTLGFRKNFELAIARTHGEIIFLSDQDDVWMKEKVRLMREHFDRNPACMLVFSNADVVDENLNRQSMDLWDSVLLKEEDAREADWKRMFLKGWYVTGATMAIRRKLFDASYPFPDTCYHDAWLGMQAALADGIEAEPARLICYRQHSNNQIGLLYSGRTRWRKRLQVLRTAGKTQIETHKERAVMYREILDGFFNQIQKNPQFCEELKDCIRYHTEMAGLAHMGFFQKMKTIARNARRQSFQKYAKDSATLRGDLLFAMLNPRYQ